MIRRSRSIAILLATSGFMFGTAVAARAAATDPCAYPNFNAQTASDLALQECGFTKVPLSGTTPLPGGGVAYQYDLPDGQVVSFPKTPPGFDPTTASPTENAAYDVPPEPPALAVEHAAWASRVAGWHTDPGAQPYIVVSDTSNRPRTITNGFSSNWGGYSQPAGQFSDWTQSFANYNEPALGSTGCSNSAVSIWTGIGGIHSNNLGQDGTASGAPGWAIHTAWFEVLPAGAIPFHHTNGTNVTASASQEIAVETIYGGNSGYSFSIQIGANGPVYTANASGAYDGSTAEEIVERPTVNGNLTPLLNYNYAVITGLNGVSGIPLGSNAFQWNMTGYETTGSLSNGTFRMTQNSCSG